MTHERVRIVGQVGKSRTEPVPVVLRGLHRGVGGARTAARNNHLRGGTATACGVRRTDLLTDRCCQNGSALPVAGGHQSGRGPAMHRTSKTTFDERTSNRQPRTGEPSSYELGLGWRLQAARAKNKECTTTTSRHTLTIGYH